MKKLKNVVILLLCLIVIAGLTVTSFVSFGGDNKFCAENINLGLDLAGGVSITYQAKEGSDPSSAEMKGALAVIQRRLDAKGYTEATAYIDGTNRIRVEIPGVKDASQAVEEIGRTALLRFVGIDWNAVLSSDITEAYYEQYAVDYKEAMTEQGQSTDDLTEDTLNSYAQSYFTNYPGDAISQYPQLLQDAIDQGYASVVVTGTNVANATYQKGQVSSSGGIESYVRLEFDATGKSLFAEGTEKYLNKKIAIMLDDTVCSIPNVSTQINDGVAVITGMATEEEAKNLASDIVGGALPVELEDIEHNSVGATLGQNALDTSLKAGIIGFCIIILFMLFMYRIPGLAASLALIFYVSAEMLIINLLGWTLTLPGIAGFILSIGMAVDANIIIFSRFREEILVGRSVRVSVRNGFKKALSAILDGNITTLIAAIVLYIFGSGTIKGFAQTLGLGIVLSMFSALLVTRLLLTQMEGILPDKSGLYCIKKIGKKEVAKS